jgi:hypothetical protein
MGNIFKNVSTNIYTIGYLIQNVVTITACIKVIPIHQYVRKEETTFIKKPSHVLKTLPLTFTNIQCPSTINSYINPPISLYNPSSFSELVARYNIINFKIIQEMKNYSMGRLQ